MSEKSSGSTRRGVSQRVLGAGLALGIGAGVLGACSQAEPIPFQITGAVEAPNCADAPMPTYKLSPNTLADGLMKERTRELQSAICQVAYSSAAKAIEIYQDNNAEARLIRSSSVDPNHPSSYLVHLASREGPKSVDMTFTRLPATDQPDLTKLESITFSSPHLDEEQRPMPGAQDRVTLSYNTQLDSWGLKLQALAFDESTGEMLQILPAFEYFAFAYGYPIAGFEQQAQQVAEILATKTDIPV